MKGSGDSLSCFHSSASASQYSISFLATSARPRHMSSNAANSSFEYMKLPPRQSRTNRLDMNTNCDFVTGHDVVVIQSPPVITKHRGRQRALRTGRMDRGASRPRLGTYREVSDALQDQGGRSRVLPGEGVRAAGDQAG